MGRGFDPVLACKNLFEAVLGLLNLPFDAKFKLVVIEPCVASRLLRKERERERFRLIRSLIISKMLHDSHSKAILKIKGKYIRSRYIRGQGMDSIPRSLTQ